MDEARSSISVALYLRGYDLDPIAVSKALRTKPDKSQYRGERQFGTEGRSYVRNIGLWAIVAKLEPESNSVTDYIDVLLSRIDFDRKAISKLSGLEEVYVDIFVAKMSDDDGGGTWELEISAAQMAKLSQIGAVR
jgi:hypothetical protein